MSNRQTYTKAELQQQLLAYNKSDSGNGERIYLLYGERMRWAPHKNAWMMWGARAWAEDESGEALMLAMKTMRATAAAANVFPDEDDVDRDGNPKFTMEKFALKSEFLNGLKNALEAMKAIPGVCVRAEDFDKDPYLFNCQNGTINLETGELQPHMSADMITKISPVVFDPGAQCPAFLRFMDQITLNDVGVKHYLNRFMGYSLSADISEHVCLFLYGHGRNGKTTIIETLRWVMGDYATGGSLSLIQKSNQDSGDNGPALARLKGARLAITPEVVENVPLNESSVKDQTGGDTITARELYAKAFDFSPSHKLLLFGNHQPSIKGGDEGIWRRIHLVPFMLNLSPDEVDKQLPQKLRAESSGILAWFVRGFAEWQKQGLNPPQAVLKAVEEYKSDMDTIQLFIDEALTPCEGFTPMGEIYEAYSAWCETEGIAPQYRLRSNKLSQKLGEKGVKRGKSKRVRVLFGYRPQ